MRTADPRVARIVEAFERLEAADVARVGRLYAADARFKDPFNEVAGRAAIERIFAHMFVALQRPRFVVHEVLVQGDQALLTWDFRFGVGRWARGELCIRGATHLRLDAEGRIAEHRDYWDAAEELYAKLPLLGPLMRWLQRRGAAR